MRAARDERIADVRRPRAGRRASGTVRLGRSRRSSNERDTSRSRRSDAIADNDGRARARRLHPCGVAANTLFNDVFTLETPGLELDETGIAVEAEAPWKDVYRQPRGFAWARVDGAAPTADDGCFDGDAHLRHVACAPATCDAAGLAAGCLGYVCRGGAYDGGKCDAGDVAVFAYRRPGDFQYLWETFPQVISPLVGVTAERFAVWMRLAAFAKFRKLYGRIRGDLKKGDVLSFAVRANYDARAFGGSKAIVVAAVGAGLETPALARMCFLLGAILVGLAGLAVARHAYAPVFAGDPARIPWLTDDGAPRRPIRPGQRPLGLP